MLDINYQTFQSIFRSLMFLGFFSVSIALIANIARYDATDAHDSYKFDSNLRTLVWTFDQNSSCVGNGVLSVSSGNHPTLPVLMDDDIKSKDKSSTCATRTDVKGHNQKVLLRCEQEGFRDIFEIKNGDMGFFYGSIINLHYLIWITTHLTASYFLFYVKWIPEQYLQYISIAWMFWGLIATVFLYNEEHWFQWQLPISNVIFGLFAIVASFGVQMYYLTVVEEDEEYTGVAQQDDVTGDLGFAKSGQGLQMNADIFFNKKNRKFDKTKTEGDHFFMYSYLEQAVTMPLLLFFIFGLSSRVMPQWMVESLVLRLYLVYGGFAFIEMLRAGNYKPFFGPPNVEKSYFNQRVIIRTTAGLNFSILIVLFFTLLTIWNHCIDFFWHQQWAFTQSGFIGFTTVAVLFAAPIVTALVQLWFCYQDASIGTNASAIKNHWKYSRIASDVSYDVFGVLRVITVCWACAYHVWYGPYSNHVNSLL